MQLTRNPNHCTLQWAQSRRSWLTGLSDGICHISVIFPKSAVRKQKLGEPVRQGLTTLSRSVPEKKLCGILVNLIHVAGINGVWLYYESSATKWFKVSYILPRLIYDKKKVTLKATNIFRNILHIANRKTTHKIYRTFFTFLPTTFGGSFRDTSRLQFPSFLYCCNIYVIQHQAF